jgi:hypothetical protein
MRRISHLEIVVHSENYSPSDYTDMCSHLVGDGYTPYGKPYFHGEYLMREFVKYEYDYGEDIAEFEELEQRPQEEDAAMQGPHDPSTPLWDEHDFFEEIDIE